MIALVNALLNGVQHHALMTMNLKFALLNYFQYSTTFQINNSKEYDICRFHNAQMHKIISNRDCKVCENKTSSKWMIGKSLVDELGSLREDSESLPNDWICGGCFSSAIYRNNIGHTNHKFASARDGAHTIL